MVELDVFWFSPPGLSPEAAGLLIFCSAMTSILTATSGVGGGVLLLAVMAWSMPLTALIPVHGVVQMGAGAGHLLIMLRSVNLGVLLPFLAGSAIGGALGAVVIVQLPPTVMQLAIGAFVLWAAWVKPPTFAVDRRAVALTGLVVTFLTMFFGATGPLITAVLKLLRLDRLSLVATQAACFVAQHGVKVVAFGFLGFAFAPYLPLAAVMIAAGFVGTLIGHHLLKHMADRRFDVILSCVLTFLALGMLAKGTAALISGPAPSEAGAANLIASGETTAGEPGMPGPATAGALEPSDERRSLTAYQTLNLGLRADLQTTQSSLSLAARRTRDLAERRRENRQRLADLERDFELVHERIDDLSSQIGAPGPTGPVPAEHASTGKRLSVAAGGR